jgi:mono/diheme cytochrome c family protein
LSFLAVLLLAPSVFAQESLPFVQEAPPTKKPERTPQNIKAGETIYIKRCLPCHGKNGSSDGAAAIFLDPRPRDFTKGIFKIKTTVADGTPTDEDHFRIVTRGIPGTAMPSWRTLLSEEERWQVIFYEQETFFPEDRRDPAKRPTPIVIPAEPPMTPESIKKGDELFHGGKAGCFVCHGNQGRGDGMLAPTIRDIWGNPQLPRNFTKSWQFKGGRDTKDIFTRMTTGIFASGMPSFKDTLTDDERWQVAHFVRSIQKELKPFGKSDIEPTKIAGEIPIDPNDKLWAGVDYIDVPMSGQVTVPPRLQTPSVDLMTVRVVYNDKEVAFHLTWDDRRSNTTHQDPAVMKAPGSEGYTTYPVLYPHEDRPTGLYRDAVAVQMAVKIPNSPEIPHFVAGSSDKPVNLWYWKADVNEDPSKGSPVEMLISKGHKKPAEPTKIQNVMGKGVFSEGQWKVVLKRPLASDDPASITPIGAGEAIPVAFHAWDGSNGEVGFQRSISSWFFLVIRPEIPPKTYVYTFGIVGLVIGLEFFLIKKVKKTKGE